MFLPGLFTLIVVLYRGRRGSERYSLRWLSVRLAVITPLYPLVVIMRSINTAVGTLRGELTQRNIVDTRQLKIIEIIGE